MSGIGNATGTAPRASEIQYGPSGLAAARLLESSLEGAASLVSDGALTGDDVILTVGTSLQGVTTPSAAPPPSTTTTTTPPPPPDVYVNSNPSPSTRWPARGSHKVFAPGKRLPRPRETPPLA